jgi:hypothetical protein
VAEYEIRVEGRLTPGITASFEGMRAAVRAGDTTLTGPIADQAALHGLLDRVAGLGLELVAVRRLGGDKRRPNSGGRCEEPRWRTRP